MFQIGIKFMRRRYGLSGNPLLEVCMRRVRVLLVALTIAGLLTLVNPPPASAGELGRTCRSFHAQGDRDNA